MTYPLINGKKGSYFQPTRFGRNEQGDWVEYDWEGTRAECEAQISGILASGGTYSYAQSVTGAKEKLTARFQGGIAGQQEVPVETWELTATPAEKDLLESDLAGKVVDRTKIDALRKYTSTGNPDDAPSSNTEPVVNTLRNLITNGTRGVRIWIPTLRHVQTVSNQWDINVSQTNVGKIIKTSRMAALEGFPTNGVLFTLPDIPNPTKTTGNPTTKFGWYKNFPDIRRAAWNKISLEQTWEYQLWSVDLYNDPDVI